MTSRWWVVLTTVVVLLVASGGGALVLFVRAQGPGAAVARAYATDRPEPAPSGEPTARPTGPNGGVLAGPSHATSPSGVACTYQPADRGAGEPRLVETPAPRATETGRVTVSIKTTLGVISVDLLADKAPCTVHAFLDLARQDYYTDTDCHRLTTDGLWILQCGDPTGTGTGTPGYQFGEENLPTGGGATAATYPRGTVAMANAGPGTNGGQFFIVYRDSAIPPAYTVFGTVVAGMDLVERIAANGTADGSTDGHPKLAVHIDEITR